MNECWIQFKLDWRGLERSQRMCSWRNRGDEEREKCKQTRNRQAVRTDVAPIALIL